MVNSSTLLHGLLWLRFSFLYHLAMSPQGSITNQKVIWMRINIINISLESRAEDAINDYVLQGLLWRRTHFSVEKTPPWLLMSLDLTLHYSHALIAFYHNYVLWWGFYKYFGCYRLSITSFDCQHVWLDQTTVPPMWYSQRVSWPSAKITAMQSRVCLCH